MSGEQWVAEAFRQADPGWTRVSKVFRETFDQLYDGQHTGRFRWDQLYKTEKTHFGTLLEINLRRSLPDVISDGRRLDFFVAGHEIDCKYSMVEGGWMVPPEAFGELLLVGHSVDAAGWWSLGVVRASENRLRPGRNRDLKAQLNADGRNAILWLAYRQAMPPNVLIGLDPDEVSRIFGLRSGQARVNELMRTAVNVRIGRNAIATVAQQDDFMKRVRSNGGARSALREEGYIIPGGDYGSHREVAAALGAEVPEPGEVVSLRVVPTAPISPSSVMLDGIWWRLAQPGDPVRDAAPLLPATSRSASPSR